MKKTKTATNKKKAEDAERQKQIDNDAFWKVLLTEFFQEAVELMHPELYAVVDWTVPFVFVEQELINSLKGRFKIKEKRKFADKLARLRLKSGKDAYILAHAEAQHEPEDDFNKRMYVYRCLIYLWSDIEDITALAIFTGEPPKADSLAYSHTCLGTEIFYGYNWYIIAEQNEQALLDSDNPFAIAVLATLYTYQTINNAERRFAFKRKVFELAQKKQIPIDRMTKLLTFVKDFMHLPETLEREFDAEEKSFSNFLMDKNMNVVTPPPYRESTRRIISDFIHQNTGKTLDDWIADAAEFDVKNRALNAEARRIKQAETQMKQTEIQLKRSETKIKKVETLLTELETRRKEEEARRKEEEARRKEEEARRKEEEARRKEEEARRKEAEAKAEILRIEAEAKIQLEREETIFKLYSTIGLSEEIIATTLNLELEYVKTVIATQLEKLSPPSV